MKILMRQCNFISVEKTPTSARTPLKNCFYIQYIVAQNIQIYFILYYFAQNKDFFSGVPEEVGVFSTEIKTASSAYSTRLPHNGDETLNIIEASAEYDVCF